MITCVNFSIAQTAMSRSNHQLLLDSFKAHLQWLWFFVGFVGQVLDDYPLTDDILKTISQETVGFSRMLLSKIVSLTCEGNPMKARAANLEGDPKKARAANLEGNPAKAQVADLERERVVLTKALAANLEREREISTKALEDGLERESLVDGKEI